MVVEYKAKRVAARKVLLGLHRDMDRLYVRWEGCDRPLGSGPGLQLFRRSPERHHASPDPGRFAIHEACDEIVKAVEQGGEDAEAKWRALSRGVLLHRLSSAVIAFASLSDEELVSFGITGGRTPSQVRMLLLDELSHILICCARRSEAGVSSRALDLKMMLDPG